VVDDRKPLATIILVEDDAEFLEPLSETLFGEGFDVLPAANAEDALRLCRTNLPDLMVVDLTMPAESGIDLVRKIRASDRVRVRLDPNLPIIGLGSIGEDPSLTHPDLGVDDMLLRPFVQQELRRRIDSVLRRRHSRNDSVVEVGELSIDPGRRRVMVGERYVRLSRKEFTLLRVLASDPTRVFSKEELLREVWGISEIGADGSRTRTLDSHASRLRGKLDPEHKSYVVNCWGVGYRLTDSV
jgi:DNA-binding response OmpR family regulator